MTLGRREALILGGVAAVAAVAGGLAGAFLVQTESGAAQLLSTPFTELAGGTRRLADWRGKALVCNFWATWCAPCREEIPLLTAAQQQHQAAGLQIVGIAIDNAPNVRQFSRKIKIGYPVLLADASAIGLMRELGNQAGGLPFTVLLDRRGRLVGRHLGPFSQSQLDGALSRLLQ